uniref:Uncharacterized protein n=1 Tax=Arundo donax TaxID=35708 RepID=A0A0A8ZEY4_ARUDO
MLVQFITEHLMLLSFCLSIKIS